MKAEAAKAIGDGGAKAHAKAMVVKAMMATAEAVKAKAVKAKAVKAKVVKAKTAEAEAEVKVKAVEAVKVAVKAMDVTAAMVEAEVEAVNEECSGSDDGGSKRRQRDLLESLLAGQLVEDQLARGPTPGQTVLICSSRSVEQH